ncbi:conserved hypothetical protein, putative membrane protein [Heliomicrobium modesticaldum Ice1]|uniref:DUF1648 domain-containing protein n=1 Tax=Heliobacterium modesticaldum (strain ATCC 51547 / Ice1) TaxID=498761 RepID=B0TDJ5_HELMI|nr:SdpI family protein [Heliomicrobium modesticaldum]ABZ85520.1 conserved hypothetical protein, putative membrane protein [Heliomicrobium modesticaldum Ice1]
MKKGVSFWLNVTLWLATVLVSLWAYPQLPEQAPVHWNYAGEADRYGSKLELVAVGPAITLLVLVLSQVLRRLDPLKANYGRFSSSHDTVMTSVIAFMFFLQMTVIANGLGWAVNVGRIVPVAVGILFIILGNVMPRVKQNHFMGFRVPWTLADPRVWDKTQRVGGYTMVLGGLAIMLLGLFAPRLPQAAGIALLLTTVLAIIFVPTVYAWWLYQKSGTRTVG